MSIAEEGLVRTPVFEEESLSQSHLTAGLGIFRHL